MTVRRGAAVGTLVCVGVALLFSPAIQVTAADSFVVIVHKDNPTSTMTASEVSKLFMKRTVRWPDGHPVVAVDLVSNSPLRDDFSRTIHGKPAGPVVAFWQQQIFSGREVPPVQLGSEEEILGFVRENRDAVGYVSAAADLGGGVKAVELSGG